MANSEAVPPKPVSGWAHPELIHLPRLTFWRRLARRLVRGLAQLLVWLFLKVQVTGLENIPARGPILQVSNHLGDADLVLGLALAPRLPEVLVKAELHEIPLLGWILTAYGVIWIRRGQPDRRAIRAALHGLAEGRMVSLAPEGRESLTGALEEGTNGAAYMALKTGAPVAPAVFIGTENRRIYPTMKRLHRTPVSVIVGQPFHLQLSSDRRTDLERGTLEIMQTLAQLLPPTYRGVYQTVEEAPHDRP